MRDIAFKENVRIKIYSRAIREILDALFELQNLYDWLPDLVVTSCNDGTHKPGSRHYTNEAMDVRSKNFKSNKEKRDFVNALQTYLGSKYTVLFESEGMDNEHFHIQVKKGISYDVFADERIGSG
jgi:hypothetical protein